MKSILFIAHSPDFYGAEKVLYQIIEAARQQYQVHVAISGPGAMSRRLEKFVDVELHFLNFPRFSLTTVDMAFNLIGFLPFLFRFGKLLSQLQPALVYGNTIRSALPCLLARKFGRPTLMHYHECNASDITGRILARLAAVAADNNIFVCRAALESYQQHVPSLVKRSCVIYNGIDPSVVSPESPLNDKFLNKSPRFITVAQLAPHKRIGDLLEAMLAIRDSCPQAGLVILGDGALRVDLEKRRAELNLVDMVMLPGYLNNIAPILSSADIFLAPFEKEACNMAVIEAMAYGKPVVAASGGGMSELVTDNATGFLYPPGEIDQLVKRSLQLAQSTELCERFGRAAAKRVQKSFNLPQQMELILCKVASCLQEKDG